MCCAVYNDIPPIIIDSIIDMDVLRNLLMSTIQAAFFPLFLMYPHPPVKSIERHPQRFKEEKKLADINDYSRAGL